MKQTDYLTAVTRMLWPRRYAHDVEEELLGHLEACETDLIAQGWPASEAQAEAQRRFGDARELGHRWARTYYGGLLQWDSLLGLGLGLLVALEPIWMGLSGLVIADGLILLSLAIVGMHLGRQVRRWRVGARTASWVAHQTFLGAFGVGLVGVGLLASQMYPVPPRGFVDWYGPSFMHHAAACAIGCSLAVIATAAIGRLGQRWRVRAHL